MQRDSHYYAVLAYARGCGFKKEAAHTIAYASQFVDDAKINHIVVNGKRHDIEGAEVKGEHTHFVNMATCHHWLRFKTLNYSSMTNNTCAFHFVPGCDRGNLVAKKFRCMPSSQVMASILKELMEDNQDNQLEKLGMVLHAFADSFSHQGFAGIPCKVNDIIKPKIISPRFCIERILNNQIRLFFRSLFRKFDMAIPPYGHGQALVFPDMAHVKWEYRYDNTKQLSAVDSEDPEEYKLCSVDNKVRFKEAFKQIKKYLTDFLARHDDHKDPEMFSDDKLLFNKFSILEDTLVKNRLSETFKECKWQKVIIGLKLFDRTDEKVFVQYDKHKWLKDAFANYKKRKFNRRSVPDVVLNDGFEYCNWYRYYKAVQWYKPIFFKYCKVYGLDIPNDYYP